MNTVSDREAAIERTIHAMTVRRLGVVDTSVVRYLDRQFAWPESAPSGVWFLLSVRLPSDSEWKLLGRRRTKHELLTLVSTLDPQHLNGRRFP